MSLLLSVLKEVGLLNFVVGVSLLNSPSVILLLFQLFRVRTEMRRGYIDRITYDKDVKLLYRQTIDPLHKDMKELTKSIDSLNTTIARHDERIKKMSD